MSPFFLGVLAILGLLVWSIVRLPGKAASRSSEGVAFGCLFLLIGTFGTPFLLTAMFRAGWFGEMNSDAAAVAGWFIGMPVGIVVGIILNFAAASQLRKRSVPPKSPQMGEKTDALSQQSPPHNDTPAK